MNLETLLPRNLSVLQHNERGEHCSVNSEPLIQITINSSLKFNVGKRNFAYKFYKPLTTQKLLSNYTFND